MATPGPAPLASATTASPAPHFPASSETFSNALGSALGGFVGVLIFFLVRLGVEAYKNRKRMVREYPCVTALNRGSASEQKGEFQHHRGTPVADAATLKELGVNREIWEWSAASTVAGNGTGGAIFFGPYSMDAAEPGIYAATFRIRGKGFTKPGDIRSDWPLLQLDVLRGISQNGYAASNNAVITYPIQQHDTLKERLIRVSELARPGWEDYELKFYSDGRGVLEYRCFAFDGAGMNPDNLSKCGNERRIFFDSVTIHKLSSVNLPEV